MGQDYSSAIWVLEWHNRAATALACVLVHFHLWGQWLASGIYSRQVLNVWLETSLALTEMGIATMSIAYKGFKWQMICIKPQASAADARVSCCWMLSHGLLFYLLLSSTGLCFVPHCRLSGAETSKCFRETTSMDDKTKNVIGIQQELMYFHPWRSPVGTSRPSSGHLVQLFMFGTKMIVKVQFWRNSISIWQCGVKHLVESPLGLSWQG